MGSDRSLPVVFDRLIERLKQRRTARVQVSQGASERVICVPDDLKTAFLTNPIFKDKIATHDLLTYAFKESGKYLAMITAEQLQHGSERIALECLMPSAAAEVVASVFFSILRASTLSPIPSRS